MFHNSLRAVAALAAAVLIVGLAGLAQAEEGVARITDSSAQIETVVFHPESGGPPYVKYKYGHGHHGHAVCPHFQQGAHGYCDYCQHYKKGGKLKKGVFKEHCCTHSADHGYSVPAKYPINRFGVQYQSTFPGKWYGAGGQFVGAYPMVYQPTDTTQLGYYYQHVPFWQPNRSMYPPRPIPAQWHTYQPPVEARWLAKRRRYGYGYHPHGYVEEVIVQPQSSEQTPPPAPSTPATEASDAPPPAPRPLNDSAANGHIRRVESEE